jgi:putative membrane-bound dehydrogenase-like protein
MQSGADAGTDGVEPVSGETVKTVKAKSWRPDTPLNRAVNKRAVPAMVALMLLSGLLQAAQTPTLTTNLARPSPAVPRTNLVSEFQVKRGFRIELVASSPMVCAPAAMAFDEGGRLFVAEMRDYPDKRDKTPRLGRVRMLQDTDGDGLYDSSTVYADELPAPSAVFCYGGGVFVVAVPELLFFKDTAKNGVADVRRVVASGFGEPGPVVSGFNLPNNLNWGWDNRIHAASGEFGGKLIIAAGGEPLIVGNNGFSFDPVTGNVALEAGAADSGCTFDSRGRKFICDAAHPLRAVMFSKADADRNMFAAIPMPVAEGVSSATPLYRFSIAPTNAARAVNVGAAGFTSVIADSWRQARGCVIYRGTAFPSNYYDHAFIPDTQARVIHHAILRDNGFETVAERAPDESNTEFVMSRDPSFHPYQIINGPDGGLYVADIMNGGDSGRILRILADTVRVAKPQTITNTVRDLVVTLANPNSWHRETAARLLIERHDPSAGPLLLSMLNYSRLPYARLQALGVLDGLGALTEAALLRGLSDMDESVRERAVSLTPKVARSGAVGDDVWTRLKILAADPSPRVRYQLCLTLGQINRSERAQVLAGLHSRLPENPWMQAAMLTAASFGAGDLLVALNSAAGWSDTSDPGIMARLALGIGMQGRQEEVQQVMDFALNSGLSRQRMFSVLAGLGEGLHRAGVALSAVDPQNRLQGLYDDCLTVTLTDTLPDAERIAALRFRAYTPYADAASGDILQLLFGTGQSEAIQFTALDTLGRYANPGVPQRIFQRWPELTPRVRTRAIDALLSRGDWIESALSAIESGQVPVSDLSSPQMDLLRNWPEQRLAQRAAHMLGAVAIHRPEVMARFSPATRQSGSRERGRDLFTAKCLGCHKPSNGREPISLDIAYVKSWSRDRLLTAIIEPNAEVRAQWAPYFVQTQQGEVWTGVFADDSPATLTLLVPGREAVVLPRGNIHYMHLQTWSLMPAGLETGMSQQDMADLLEYLCPR